MCIFWFLCHHLCIHVCMYIVHAYIHVLILICTSTLKRYDCMLSPFDNIYFCTCKDVYYLCLSGLIVYILYLLTYLLLSSLYLSLRTLQVYCIAFQGNESSYVASMLNIRNQANVYIRETFKIMKHLPTLELACTCT